MTRPVLKIVRAIRSLAAVALVATLAACAPSAAIPPGVTVLRFASPYPPTHPFSQADIAWMKHVEEQAGGKLKIQPFWGGTLISSEHAVLELSHGIADIALVTPIYSRAGMKAIKAQAGFYEGARTASEQAAVYKCLAKKFPIMTEEMAGVRVLAVQGGNLLHVLTHDDKVTTLEDLRGLRLRTPAEIAPLLRVLGADPVTMPMGEVYSAMSKGVVDGVVSPADTLRSMHFSEVARYMSMLVIPRGAYPARAISDRSWARLSPELQKVLADAQPYWESQLEASVMRAEAAGLKFGKADGGMTFVDFDPAEQAKFDQMYNDISLKQASVVSHHGVDGVGMFKEAQAVIGEIRAGRPAC